MGVPVDLGTARIEGKVEASFTVGEYSNVHYGWLVRDGAQNCRHTHQALVSNISMAF